MKRSVAELEKIFEDLSVEYGSATAFDNFLFDFDYAMNENVALDLDCELVKFQVYETNIKVRDAITQSMRAKYE